MIQPDLLERIKQIESLIPDENKEEMSDLYDDVNYKCLMIDMNNEQKNKEKTTTLSPEGKRIKKQKQIAYLKSTKQVLLEMLKAAASEKKYQQSLSTQELYGNQQELLEQAQIPNTSSKEWMQEEKCEVSHAPVEKIGPKERRLYVTGIRRP